MALLNRVHKQRIALAAQVLRDGYEVTIRVLKNPGAGACVVWSRPGGAMSVIAAGGRRAMDQLCRLAQAELEAQMKAGTNGDEFFEAKEDGAVAAGASV